MFQRTLRKRTWQMGRNTLAMWSTAPLPYLLMTVDVNTLEKVSFSNVQNPKTVC